MIQMLSGVVGYPNPPPTSGETKIILDFLFFRFLFFIL